MSIFDQFLIGLKAYQDVQTELEQEDGNMTTAQETKRDDTITADSPLLSGGSLLLGITEDGLPLILDLYDPTPGPILVAGDGGSGKTTLLQYLAQASNLMDPSDIQFGVVTPFPEEWTGLETLPNNMGIWPVYHVSSHHFLSRLCQWADALPATRQSILLLLDGLDLLTSKSFSLQQELYWLLRNGPSRHVWPVVSVNPGHLSHMLTWLDYFRSRILGRVKHDHNARLLVENPDSSLSDLIPGTEYAFCRANCLVKFTLPPFIERGYYECRNAVV